MSLEILLSVIALSASLAAFSIPLASLHAYTPEDPWGDFDEFDRKVKKEIRHTS